MNVELLVSLVSEHKELYDKRDSDYKNLDKRELVFLVFLFYIKRHLMSGNEFACSLGSSSAKIAWVWTQKTRWKTLANNARRYSSRCVRPLTVYFWVPRNQVASLHGLYFIIYISYKVQTLHLRKSVHIYSIAICGLNILVLVEKLQRCIYKGNLTFSNLAMWDEKASGCITTAKIQGEAKPDNWYFTAFLEVELVRFYLLREK